MVSLLLAIIYLSFISLGLPDALLGAAWPTMCVEFDVPVSFAGMVSITISIGTIISSLCSDRVSRWLGTGKVTAISVAMTALALLGFSLSNQYWMLILFAIPYGLGAGSVDAGLNNYVALHYASRHMSWLHCMWGVGASIGPYIMGYALTGGQGWNMGYRYIALLQMALTGVLIVSIPLWKSREVVAKADPEVRGKALRFSEILTIPGAVEAMMAFFCYCALENTAILWSATYLVQCLGLDADTAASFASTVLIGITVGRGASGLLTYKFNDTNMIRIGEAVIGLGIVLMILPLGQLCRMGGLLLVGLGCAPIFPCMLHATPDHFGAERSQALIGLEMASAYVGILVAPPFFGLIVDSYSASLMPVYCGAILILMIVMCEQVNRKSKG